MLSCLKAYLEYNVKIRAKTVIVKYESGVEQN